MEKERGFEEIVLGAFEANSTTNPPEVLFHYTTLDSAMKILESDSLHAADIRYLNDSLEHQYAWRVLQSLARGIGASSNDGQAKVLLSEIARIPSTHLHYSGGAFVCSFSEESDLLSQWRAYGEDGRGVALGFSTSSGLGHRGDGDTSLPFVRVLYDEVDQRAALEPHLHAILASVGKEPPQVNQTLLREALDALQTLVALLGPAIKNPAFSEEREWRAVVNYTGPLAPLELTRVRRGRSGLVPYCELRTTCSGPRPSLPLQTIVVGPRFDGLQLSAFITYLATQGYEAAMPGLLAREDHLPGARRLELQRSKASYR